jgi:ribosomal protein L40E
LSETLTASFCERCGKRQEFRAPTGLNPVRKTRGFIGGLRNYLVGQEGLSDAMREAMQVQESAIAAKQLEAFHASIHLCLGCRQYTCNDCWNVTDGKCRTCAPMAGVDDLADRIAASLDPATAAFADPAAVVPVFEHTAAEPLPAESWPTADREVYAATAAATETDPGYALAVVPPEPEFADATPVEPEVVAVATDDDALIYDEPEPVAAEIDEWAVGATAEDPDEPTSDEAFAAAAQAEPADEVARPLLRVVAWDDDLPAAASPDQEAEEEPAAAEAIETGVEPAVAATADDEPYAALRDLDAEPFMAERTSWIAEVEQEDEWAAQRAAAEREAAAAAPEFEPTPIAASFGADADAAALDAPAEAEAPLQEPPAATMATPAIDLTPQPLAPAAAAPRRSGPMRDRITRRPDEPRRPRRERGVAADAGAEEIAARQAQLEELGLSPDAAPDAQSGTETPQILPYWSRGAAQSNRDATLAAIRQGSLVWEASAREVDAGGVTVQSCGECGLALSASAKFCRRCGTRQAQPA